MIYTDRLVISEKDITSVSFSDNKIVIVTDKNHEIVISSNNISDLTTTFKEITAKMKIVKGE